MAKDSVDKKEASDEAKDTSKKVSRKEVKTKGDPIVTVVE